MTAMNCRNFDKDDLSIIINDFISDYQTYSLGKNLDAIYVIVNADTLINITIQDYPLGHLHRDIRNMDINDLHVIIGKFHDIPIKLYYNKSLSDFKNIIKYDTAFVNQVIKKENKSEIDEGLIEYDPLILTTYLPVNRSKTMSLFDGRVINDKY